MNIIYLLLGSNQQQPAEQLLNAINFIKKEIGDIKRQSSVYKTAAWGNMDQPDFLNQVIIISSAFAAEIVINNILSIEKKMGRIRTKKNAPRIIDIDILFFNKQIIKTQALTVPHIALSKRRFVLVPLNELSPNFVHPVLHQTIHRLLINCLDKLAVEKI